MDYQCECGEEFDIFDEFSTNYFTTLGEDDEGGTCLLVCYDITCPHCEKRYQIQEEYAFVKVASVYPYE